MKTETGKNSLGVWESWNLNRLSGAFNVEYTGGRRCAKMASLRKIRYDLLHWHPTQRRAGLPVRLAHQRGHGPDQHVPENDDLREAGRPLYGHAVGRQLVRGAVHP